MDLQAIESEEFNCNELRLDNLPTEIFLIICTYLDAKFVISCLSKVCKSFHFLINNDSTWKIRIGKRWSRKYPPVKVGDANFDWKQACIEREEQYKFWTQIGTYLDHYSLTNGHYSAVDAVHLMKEGTLCASGSRDRSVKIWDLTKLDDFDPKSIAESKIWALENAHSGWVWSLSSFNNTLCSASWDTTIKLWDLKVTHRNPILNMTCGGAVLCTAFRPDILVAGNYDKCIYLFDVRAHNNCIDKFSYHKHPVLCLAADDNCIITGSEDKTIVLFDRRKNTVFKSIKLSAFILALSYNYNQVWAGDKRGQVHLIDATQGNFKKIQTYDVGHTDKVTGILWSLGSLISCSTDKSIRILEPGLNPSTISVLKENSSELAAIDFQNSVLATASCDSTVGIWKPKITNY